LLHAVVWLSTVNQNFMENNPVAISIIADYMDTKRGNTKQQQQQQQQRQHSTPRQATPVLAPAHHHHHHHQQQQQQRASYSTSVAAAAKPSPVQRAAAAKQEKDKWLNLGRQQQQNEAAVEAGQVRNNSSTACVHVQSDAWCCAQSQGVSGNSSEMRLLGRQDR
jgi:hypothetical protein